jgi:transcriptional regulator with GAF, ATPase, and Fis domain
VALAAGIALLASGTVGDLGVAGTLPFRIGTVVLVVALAAYVVEKELHLRRLAQLLIVERITAATMQERLRELEALHTAGTAMNSVLVIEEVLRVILTSAVELLRPRGGAILLLEDSDTLVVVCTVGETVAGAARSRVGEGLAGRVAQHQQTVLVSGAAADGSPVPTASAICVPLLHRSQLLGVLQLSGSDDRGYTDVDVQSATLFADHAAIAIANARLSDTERDLNARLEALAGVLPPA